MGNKKKSHLSKNITVNKHNSLNGHDSASNDTISTLNINDIFLKIKQWDDSIHQEKTLTNPIIHPELPREFDKEQIFYGSHKIIQQSPSYQIGKMIVQNDISISKSKVIIHRLLNLFNNRKKFFKDDINLKVYRDIDEAEKIKNHLSYKIGNTLVEGLSSPIKFVKMPTKMAREVISFKKKH